MKKKIFFICFLFLIYFSVSVISFSENFGNIGFRLNTTNSPNSLNNKWICEYESDWSSVPNCNANPTNSKCNFDELGNTYGIINDSTNFNTLVSGIIFIGDSDAMRCYTNISNSLDFLYTSYISFYCMGMNNDYLDGTNRNANYLIFSNSAYTSGYAIQLDEGSADVGFKNIYPMLNLTFLGTSAIGNDCAGTGIEFKKLNFSDINITYTNITRVTLFAMAPSSWVGGDNGIIDDIDIGFTNLGNNSLPVCNISINSNVCLNNTIMNKEINLNCTDKENDIKYYSNSIDTKEIIIKGLTFENSLYSNIPKGAYNKYDDFNYFLYCLLPLGESFSTFIGLCTNTEKYGVVSDSNDFDTYKNLITNCNVSSGWNTANNFNYGISVGFNNFSYYNAYVNSNICKDIIVIYSDSSISTLKSTITLSLDNDTSLKLWSDLQPIILNKTTGNTTIIYPNGNSNNFSNTYFQFIFYRDNIGNYTITLYNPETMTFLDNQTLTQEDFTSLSITLLPLSGKFSFDYVFFLSDIPYFQWSTSIPKYTFNTEGKKRLTYYVTDEIHKNLNEYNTYSYDLNLPVCSEIINKETYINNYTNKELYGVLYATREASYAMCGSITDIFNIFHSSEIGIYKSPDFCKIMVYIIWFFTIFIGILMALFLSAMIKRFELVLPLSGIFHITLMFFGSFIVDYYSIQIIISGIVGAICLVSFFYMFISGMNNNSNSGDL